MEVLNGNAWVTLCDWSQVPHLDEAAKASLLESYPVYQRDARSKGIPSLGAGAIYPVQEGDIVIPDFDLPAHWPRAYGLDVGWRRTAAVWMALNRDTDTLYLYAEHYRGEAEAVVHAAAIKARGPWIPGAIDPSARGRSQVDGRALLQMYRDLGLDVVEADPTVESGIYLLLMRMTTGRLKVFRSLQNWLSEFRLYRRDEKGKIVKENDHLLDATRYGHSKFLDICKSPPAPAREPRQEYVTVGTYSTGWMG
jgi:Terminase RNaseH-like domain